MGRGEAGGFGPVPMGLKTFKDLPLEMEYGCRAGAATSRYYGESEVLLGKYGWYLQNSEDHTWPVGSLKPNDFGCLTCTATSGAGAKRGI
jgi:formylglycine-generating enzyme required for sulfatase activity